MLCKTVVDLRRVGTLVFTFIFCLSFASYPSSADQKKTVIDIRSNTPTEYDDTVNELLCDVTLSLFQSYSDRCDI